MFLKSIRLTGIKCFEEAEFECVESEIDDLITLRPWTVLVGENGFGKTTLLQAIALLTSGPEVLQEVWPNPADWLRVGESKGTLTAEVLVNGFDLQSISLDIAHGASTDSVLEQNPEYAAFFETHGGFQVYSLFGRDVAVARFEAWLADSGSQFEAAKAWLNRLMNDIQVDVVEDGVVYFETEHGRLPFRALSEGDQQVFAGFGDLYQQAGGAPESAFGLILIDNFALHLHPRAQRQILYTLRETFPQCQFVVTTNSVLAAHQAGRGELQYIEREGGKLEIEQYLGNPRELVLDQFVTTDVFGIESDESLDVELKKARYRELRDGAPSGAGTLSIEEEESDDELSQLEAELGERVTGGRYTLISDAERDVLNLILQEKSGGDA